MTLGVGVACTYPAAVDHFSKLQALVAHLGIQEATHKATLPATSMVWLGLLFDSVAMTVTLPPAKLKDLVTIWTTKQYATLHDLLVLMVKLLYMAQVCPPAHLFLNRIC